jgi:thiol:disulfide interchange protein DsbA
MWSCNRAPMAMRRLRKLAMTFGALTALLLSSAPQAALEEGKNFVTLVPPHPTSQRNKIEVVEFFSYACPHCAHFYPMISDWLAKLPRDVAFRRVPVGFGRDPWINLQRTYYALESTGDLARLDGPLFRAIHEERKPLFDESSIADWVGGNGGNADKFSTAYVSFGINNQTFQADQMAQDYQISGIPALAVDGHYVALVPAGLSETEGLHQLLVTTDELIARVRSERAARKQTASSSPKAK